MATSLQTYKERYPNVYGNLSDVDAIYKMAERTGRDPQSLAEHFGMYDPDQGDFARGVSSGVDSLQGGLYGLVGYVGDAVGSDAIRDFGYEGYEQNMKQVGLRAKETDNIENAESVGDYVDAAQYWLGYAIPQIIEAVVVSKGAGAVTKKAAEKQIRSQLQKEYGGKLNKGALNAVMSSKSTQAKLAEVLPKATRRGEYTGLAGQAIGTELGYTYGGAVDKALEEGKTKEEVDLMRVTKYGTLAGVAEFGAEALTLGLAKVGPAKNLFETGKFTTKSRTVNAASRGLGGGTLEAGTEAVQTGLEEMGAGATFEEANFSDPTSAFAGFVGGSAMGTVGGALSKKQDPLAVIDDTAEQAQQNVADKQQEADELRRQEQEKADRELREEAAAAEQKIALRKKHSKTFISEEELSEETKAEQELINNLQLTTPDSELDIQFQTWLTENRKYITKNEKANEKIRQEFLNSLPKPQPEDNLNNYELALDDHASLQEAREQRAQDPAFVPEENDGRLADYYQRRMNAIAAGDLAALREVESEAETNTIPGEWPAYKREADIQILIAQEQGKVEEQEGAITKPPVVKKPDASAIETLDDINLQLSPQTNQVWEFIKSTVANDTIDNYYKVEQTEGKGSNKAKGWSAEKISKELGLKGKGNVSQAITRIKNAVKSTYGQDFETILNGIVAQKSKPLIAPVTDAEAEIRRENDVTGAAIDESESTQGEPVNPNEILENPGFNIRDSEGQTKLGEQKLIRTENVPGTDPVGQRLAGLSPEERAKAEAEIKKANEAEAALAKQQTEEEGSAELDEQGQARRDEAHEKRIQDVQVVFRTENKETLEPIQQEWDNNKKGNDPKFSDMSLRNRSEWVLATAVALETGNDSGLQQARQDIIQKHTGEQKNESKRGTETQTKKVPEGTSKGDTKKAEPRGQTDTAGKNSGAKVRKPAKVVRPKTTASKKEIRNLELETETAVKEEATKRLGAGWQAKHPNLTKLLKQKKYKKFVDTVETLEKEAKAKTKPKAKTPPVAKSTAKKKPNFVVPTRAEETPYKNKLDELQFQQHKKELENMFVRLVGVKNAEKILQRVFIGRNNKDLAKQMGENPKDTADAAAFVSKTSTRGSYVRPRSLKLRRPDIIAFNVEEIQKLTKKDEIGPDAFFAVFMHEVGGHIGLDNILSPAESQALAAQIRKWAKEYKEVKRNGGKPSVEQRAANATMEDMGDLDLTGDITDAPTKATSTASSNPDAETTKELKETIAYFLHHSVARGVKPSENTDVGKILNKFRTAIKKFLGVFQQKTFDITGQDVVNMAYGAGAMEIMIEVDAGNPQLRTSQKVLENMRKVDEDTEMAIMFSNVSMEIERKESRDNRRKLAEFRQGGDMKKMANLLDDVIKELKDLDKTNSRQLDAVKNFNSNDFWDNKINEYVAKIIPKNDKNKYIAPTFLPVNEWREFQIKRGREEKQLRAKLKEEIKRRREDAAKHEQRLYDPDETTTDIDYALNRAEKKESQRNDEKARTWIKTNFGESAAVIWDTISNLFVKAAESTQFLHQLIRKYENVMPAAKDWHKAILRLEKTRNEIKQQIDEIQVKARAMASDKLVAAEAFIKDSTERQLWAYNPFNKSDPRYEKIQIDGAMERRFNKLDADQQELVKDIFAHGEKMLARKRQIAKMFFGDEKDPDKKKLGEKFFGVSGLEGPYAPLRRFGSHVVEFKSQKYLDAEKAYEEDGGQDTRQALEDLKTNPVHYEVSFHGSIGIAKQYRDSRESEFAFAEASEKTAVVTEGRSPDYKILDQVLARMGVEGLDKSSKEYQQIQLMVKNMYFESLSEENARRSQQKRRTIPGAEKSMVRSFVVNATAEANLIANMEHGTAVNTALGEANKEMKKDRPTLGRIYNMIVSHYTSNLNEKPTPIQDRLAAINTVYMLTSSIGYHVTNATQPIMVTIPKLAGDFGATSYVKSLKLYWKGLRMAKELVTFDAKNLKFQTNIDITKAPKKYQALLTELQERQLLDVGLEQDLANFNKSDSGFQLINKGTEAASTLAHRLYQVARMVEAYNRISTATAAFELAQSKPQVVKKQGMESAQDYAISVVEDTQGNFSSMDAPQILKKLPKLTGQYRKYQIMMAWVYADSIKKSLAGATPYEKAAGKRTMGFMMGHAALFSGAVGVPVIGQIAPFLMGMLNEGDEPEDLERWIGENIGDETWAKIISRGLPTVFGIDMSTKLSQQKIFHPAPYTDFELSEQALAQAVFEIVAGPSAATASNVMRSISYGREGNAWRATEYALPKGIRTIMESYRLGTEGYSLRNGDVPVGADAFSGFQLVVNSLGIPATDINNVKWVRGQQFELSKWFSDEQSKIRKRYINAKKEKNRKDAREAIDDWKRLQNAKDRVRPFFNDARSAIKRTSLSSLIKAPARQRTRERNYRDQLGID